MSATIATAIAANRFGLGARPGELAAIGGDGRDWLRAQLAGGAPSVTGAELRPSQALLAEALELRRNAEAARRAAAAAPAAPGAPEAAPQDPQQRLPQLLRPIYTAEATARFRHAVGTDRPFVERLTWFWTNHFAVSVDKQLLAGIAGSFEREAIRPHVLGNFTDLLLAVESHPAMILYLDNQLSMGPDSILAQRLARRDAARSGRAHRGINENLAREILELHTLGVGAGYTQADVTAFAQVLTGWSIGGGRGPDAQGEPGRFVFREGLHQPGAQVILGRRYSEDGYAPGVAVLRQLARHESTARHVATKLARHFIADEPPPEAVAQIAHAFLRGEGDLPLVYRALIDARAAWESPFAKYKTPSDYVVSTYRGLGLSVDAARAALAPFETLGQRTWQPESPAGWPDRAVDWDGASALIKRLEWAEGVGARLGSEVNAAQVAPDILGGNLSSGTRTALAHAASGAQAITLLLAAPEFMRR